MKRILIATIVLLITSTASATEQTIIGSLDPYETKVKKVSVHAGDTVDVFAVDNHKINCTYTDDKGQVLLKKEKVNLCSAVVSTASEPFLITVKNCEDKEIDYRVHVFVKE